MAGEGWTVTGRSAGRPRGGRLFGHGRSKGTGHLYGRIYFTRIGGEQGARLLTDLFGVSVYRDTAR